MVGLSSYLLISYWFTRIETSLGGILAILMNRIGDVFYLLGILISLLLYNSVDILTLISTNIGTNGDILLFFFFLAAMAKSAQIFLHIWLPYSMEGPTPISALLHAATCAISLFIILDHKILSVFFAFNIQNPDFILNTSYLVLWNKPKNSLSKFNKIYLNKIERNILQLTTFMKSIIIGILLSDGWVQITYTSKYSRIGFKQSIIN